MTLAELKNTKGRILGVDFGEARTGLAVSDLSRFLASGLGNVKGGGLSGSAERIVAAAKEQGAVAVVLGLPVNMNGTEGPRAERCRQLAATIGELCPDLPVVLADERMTTQVTSRFLNETDTRGKKRKGVIDTLSAQIILQDVLDRLKYL